MTPRAPVPTAALFESGRTGDRAAVARLLSLVERGGDEARELGRIVAEQAGDAYTIGLTGAPGAGKSTLASALVRHVRAGGDEIAVLAVDPSSPFTGGAILGDRVRMQDHATDPGVYIRSMATRGHLGGLALATPEAVRLLAALGWRLIVIETVGVGQVEVEVAGKADTTVVVVNPGWGDSVQASKAGLLEVADVFAINKSDRPGAKETQVDLEQMLDLAPQDGWRAPIVSTVATEAAGVAELWAAIADHRRAATGAGVLERRRATRLRDELGEIVARRLSQRARELCGEQRWAELVDAVAAGTVDPWTAADEMVRAVE